MRDDRTDRGEHDLYRLLFECFDDAMAILDDRGRVQHLNRAARHFDGLDVQRLIEDDADLTDFRAAMLVGGRACVEIRRPRAGRAPRVVTVQARLLGASFLVLVRDVTDSRAEARELGHLRRVESLGYLAASMVHDFNNMLTPILFSAALLEQHASEERVRTALVADIRASAERAAALVHQVLSFARRTDQTPKRTNIAATVDEMRPLIARVVGESVEVAIESDATRGDVIVDRGQLEHVILNLAANARDAMPRGGRLTIRTANVALGEFEADARGCASAGAYVSLVVSDTGVGMSPEVRERIFERFFTTKGEGGTGLGLATAHRFVTKSGGCISVRSAQGDGTTVAIYLPRAEPLPSDAAPPTPRADLPRGDETILVVEDDEHVRRVVRAVLEEQGYAVLDAASADGAIARARAHSGPIALLLTDVVLPGACGRVLVGELRAAGQDPKVLFMSGHTEKALEQHGFSPDDPLLRKAFSPSELARKVREVLDD